MCLSVNQSKGAACGKHLRLVNRIERTTTSIKHNNKITNYSASSQNNEYMLKDLSKKKHIWRTFPRQQLALDFAKKCRYGVGVFSWEDKKFGMKGQRHYLVCSYYNFVNTYIEDVIKYNKKQHFYEVITEKYACRLYFDIEYSVVCNPYLNGIDTLNIFIDYICYCLLLCYNLRCFRHNVLDLDSSSPQKFSHHIVFHLANGSIFQNNLEMGKFVNFVCDQLRLMKSNQPTVLMLQEVKAINKLNWKSKIVKCPSKSQLMQIFIATNKGTELLICDESVYTKNRNFRLYLSTKLCKENFLKLAKNNTFISQYDSQDCSTYSQLAEHNKTKYQNILYDSLVCYVQVVCDVRHQNILDFNTSILCSVGSNLDFQPTFHTLTYKPFQSPDTKSCVSMHDEQSSLFPFLDDYIKSIIRVTTDNSAPGVIRRCTFFSQSSCVLYDITGYRYCYNVGRHHKSNNIILVVNLENYTIYQKCQDFDCRKINFKSSEIKLPKTVIDIFESVLFELDNNNDALDDNCFENAPLHTNEEITSNLNQEEFNSNNYKLSDNFNDNPSIPLLNNEGRNFASCINNCTCVTDDYNADITEAEWDEIASILDTAMSTEENDTILYY